MLGQEGGQGHGGRGVVSSCAQLGERFGHGHPIS